MLLQLLCAGHVVPVCADACREPRRLNYNQFLVSLHPQWRTNLLSMQVFLMTQVSGCTVLGTRLNRLLMLGGNSCQGGCWFYAFNREHF